MSGKDDETLRFYEREAATYAARERFPLARTASMRSSRDSRPAPGFSNSAAAAARMPSTCWRAAST